MTMEWERRHLGNYCIVPFVLLFSYIPSQDIGFMYFSSRSCYYCTREYKIWNLREATTQQFISHQSGYLSRIPISIASCIMYDINIFFHYVYVKPNTIFFRFFPNQVLHPTGGKHNQLHWNAPFGSITVEYEPTQAQPVALKHAFDYP